MNNNINTQVYAQKVELLLRLMPIVMEEGVFAVHGGTAINLFLKDLPRYSVDRFLISFEKGEPQWDGYEFEYFKDYPSVKWKLINLAKLSKQNPQKLVEEACKLELLFGI